MTCCQDNTVGKSHLCKPPASFQKTKSYMSFQKTKNYIFELIHYFKNKNSDQSYPQMLFALFLY